MEEHQQQQMLDLSKKGMKELSLEYGPCPSVMSLNLDNNHLHTLNGVEQFPCLMQLSARVNRLGDMSPLSHLSHLVILNLQNNSITNIQGLTTLCNLQWICLAGNSIKDANSVTSCVSLTHLDLSDNFIKYLPDLSKLTVLKTLLLHGNGLKTLQNSSSILPSSLHILTLAENGITNLNEFSSLSHLNLLRQLSVMGNPCTSLITPNGRIIEYRSYVLYWCPGISVLDGISTTDLERYQSRNLFFGYDRYPFGFGQHEELVQYLFKKTTMESHTSEVSPTSTKLPLPFHPPNKENLSPNNLPSYDLPLDVSKRTHVSSPHHAFSHNTNDIPVSVPNQVNVSPYRHSPSKKAEILETLKALRYVQQMIHTQEQQLLQQTTPNTREMATRRLEEMKCDEMKYPVKQEQQHLIPDSHELKDRDMYKQINNTSVPGINMSPQEPYHFNQSSWAQRSHVHDLSSKSHDQLSKSHDVVTNQEHTSLHVEDLESSSPMMKPEHNSLNNSPMTFPMTTVTLEKSERVSKTSQMCDDVIKLPNVPEYSPSAGGGLLQSLSNFLPVTDNTSIEYYDPSSLASSISQAYGFSLPLSSTSLSNGTKLLDTLLNTNNNITYNSITNSNNSIDNTIVDVAMTTVTTTTTPQLYSVTVPEFEDKTQNIPDDALSISETNGSTIVCSTIGLNKQDTSGLLETGRENEKLCNNSEVHVYDFTPNDQNEECVVTETTKSLEDIQVLELSQGVEGDGKTEESVSRGQRRVLRESNIEEKAMAGNRSKEKDKSSSFERIGFEDAEMGSGIGHIVTDVTQEMDRERAAIIIQRAWRGYQCRNLLKLHKAAVKIQATWRGYHCRHYDPFVGYVYREMRRKKIEAYIVILFMQLQGCREELAHQIHTVQIQEEALKSLLCEVEDIHEEKRKENRRKRNRAAITIQKYWRGYQSRKINGCLIKVKRTNNMFSTLQAQITELQESVSQLITQQQIPFVLPAPVKLFMSHYSNSCLLVQWDTPTYIQYPPLMGYKIYVNGESEGMVNPGKNKAYIEGLDAAATYRITVRALYEGNLESPDSNMVMASLGSSPLPYQSFPDQQNELREDSYLLEDTSFDGLKKGITFVKYSSNKKQQSPISSPHETKEQLISPHVYDTKVQTHSPHPPSPGENKNQPISPPPPPPPSPHHSRRQSTPAPQDVVQQSLPSIPPSQLYTPNSKELNVALFTFVSTSDANTKELHSIKKEMATTGQVEMIQSNKGEMYTDNTTNIKQLQDSIELNDTVKAQLQVLSSDEVGKQGSGDDSACSNNINSEMYSSNELLSNTTVEDNVFKTPDDIDENWSIPVNPFSIKMPIPGSRKPTRFFRDPTVQKTSPAGSNTLYVQESLPVNSKTTLPTLSSPPSLAPVKLEKLVATTTTIKPSHSLPSLDLTSQSELYQKSFYKSTDPIENRSRLYQRSFYHSLDPVPSLQFSPPDPDS